MNMDLEAQFILFSVFAVVALTGAGIFGARQLRRKKQKEAELRLAWRRKFEKLANDLGVGESGWSLDSVLAALEESDWDDIYYELEKMPPGKRSFQKAVQICDREECHPDEQGR
jgi:hypothetical protein